MKLSYNWFKEFLLNFKLIPKKPVKPLNTQVASVKETHKLSKGLDKVVVAEILEIKPHPHADRLRIATVKYIIHNSEFIIRKK